MLKVEMRELGKVSGPERRQSHLPQIEPIQPLSWSSPRQDPHPLVALHFELLWAAPCILLAGSSCGCVKGEAPVLGCPLASTSAEGGGGPSRVAAMAPKVQGTPVSPGTSVSAVTHLGWWFCLHDPKQPVWVRSSQKDWGCRATRGQKKMTSFKERMRYSLKQVTSDF